MRVEGWESKLAAYINDAFHKDFVWGQHDCALWCAEWVRQATGEDFLSDWVGLYDSEESAFALMKSRGFNLPADIADAHLERIDPRMAKRGDLLLHPERHTLGICVGMHGVFLASPSGTIVSKTTNCPLAWRV